MSTSRVSILIPNYNYARFLPETLDSVLQQDYHELEILIADDASNDHSHDICQAYARKDTRIRYHRHARNLGMVANWNWCLQQARGDYIRLLMADDLICSPSAITRMADILDADPHIAFVTSARKQIDENTHAIDPLRPYASTNCLITPQQWISQHLMRVIPEHLNSIGEPSAVLFRKNMASRGFDASLQQFVDLEMWLHLLQQGNMYYLCEPLCAFRKHPQQQTEYNRKIGLHRLEELELYARYSPQPYRDRHRYRIMRRMRKEGHPQANNIHRNLRQEFGYMRMATHAIRYRLNRLKTNISRR